MPLKDRNDDDFAELFDTEKGELLKFYNHASLKFEEITEDMDEANK